MTMMMTMVPSSTVRTTTTTKMTTRIRRSIRRRRRNLLSSSSTTTTSSSSSSSLSTSLQRLRKSGRRGGRRSPPFGLLFLQPLPLLLVCLTHIVVIVIVVVVVVTTATLVPSSASSAAAAFGFTAVKHCHRHLHHHHHHHRHHRQRGHRLGRTTGTSATSTNNSNVRPTTWGVLSFASSSPPSSSPLRSSFLPSSFATPPTTSSTTTTTTPATSNTNAAWFPTKIQQDVDYASVVQSLYVRHIVVERYETARLALELYLNNNNKNIGSDSDSDSDSHDNSHSDDGTVIDRFGYVAQLLSACTKTRPLGGTIGWMDVVDVVVVDVVDEGDDDVQNKWDTTTTTTTTTATEDQDHPKEEGRSHYNHNHNNHNKNDHDGILPQDVFQRLLELQPKAGDVHIVESNAGPIHVVQVQELYVRPPAHTLLLGRRRRRHRPGDDGTNNKSKTMDPGNKNDDDNYYYDDDDTTTTTTRTTVVATTDGPRLGSHSGINALVPRNRLKGAGVVPHGPDFTTTTKTRTGKAGVAPKTYTIQTQGCQMNVADSERLEGILVHDLGLVRVDDDGNDGNGGNGNDDGGDDDDNTTADVVVFNTCSIRDRAEQKLYDALGPWRRRKRNGKKALALIVTGCVAQQEGQDLLRAIPEVDAVLGPQYVPYLGNVLENIEFGGHQVCLTAPMLIPERTVVSLATTARTNNDTVMTTKTRTTSAGSQILPSTTVPIPYSNDDFGARPLRGHTVRAWVNVIYGCNEHCTYCVVPATRGMEQSRSMESILQECLNLVQSGYKEVTLLGQNIDAYGRDMHPKRSFADLLHYLNTHLSNYQTRIRYVTSHPRYFSDRVIDAVATLPQICECFHMPFQAGDNEVLRRMRRGYTYESYLKIIDKIRHASPDAAITADVIVGFPGETEEAFERTLDIMRAVKFDNLNSFAYSPRPNTEAATWDDEQIPEDIKKERLARVQALAVEHALERSQRYLGRTLEVLVEDTNPRYPQTQVMGRTRQGRQVYFDGSIDALKGAFVMVEIVEARTWSLVGKRVHEEMATTCSC